MQLTLLIYTKMYASKGLYCIALYTNVLLIHKNMSVPKLPRCPWVLQHAFWVGLTRAADLGHK